MIPLWNGQGLPTPKYGNVAMKKLLEKMYSYGAERKNMRAKLFGGASLYGRGENSVMKIGEKNVEFAENFLQNEDIAIIGADTGGERGRKIFFDMESGKVRLKILTNSIGEAFPT